GRQGRGAGGPLLAGGQPESAPGEPESLNRSVEVLEQPLDVIEFELRAEALTEAATQLLENAAGALHVDLARYFYSHVVAVIASARRAPPRGRRVVGGRRR